MNTALNEAGIYPKSLGEEAGQPIPGGDTKQD